MLPDVEISRISRANPIKAGGLELDLLFSPTAQMRALVLDWLL